MKSKYLSDINESEFLFEEIFNLNEIQRLQDLFSEANEVASIITQPDGTPITKPSNFTRFCFEIIRKSEIGRCNCFKSDAEIGQYNASGPTVRKCLSGGLWDAGVSITVGNTHIGNWLIGQVKNEEVSEEEVAGYANEIGVDRNDLIDALREVPVMSVKRFRKIAEMLFAFVNTLSDKAHKNLLLKKEIEERERVVQQKNLKELELFEANNEIRLISENLPNAIWKAEISPEGNFVNTYISDIVDDLLGLPKGTINNSFDKYFSYVESEEVRRIYKRIQDGLQHPEESHHYAYEIRKANNEIAWFQSTGKVYIQNEKLQIIGITVDITEQKRKEQELIEARAKAEESKERFELAMQVTLDGPYDRNLITNEIYYSPRWKEIIGYKPDELPNELAVWEKLTRPEDFKKAMILKNKHIAGEVDKYEIEFQMKHKNGHWVDILARGMAHFDENGKAVRLVGTHIDITERKKAEKQLRENEERFRKLTEHLPSGIAIYKPVNEGNDFEFIDVNKTAESITNASRASLVGHTFLEKFPNMVNSPLYKALIKVNKTGKDEFIPSFYYKDSVREGWRENHIYKLQTGEIVAIFRDTTEIKNAEQTLITKNKELVKAKLIAEQNEKRFKALHDASFGGIAIHDKGKILDCNKGLSKLTGFKQKELIGMDGLLLIAERSRKKVMKRIVAEYKKPYEAFAVRKNGEEYPVRLEGRMIPYNGKKVRVVEFRDITEIKMAEYELIAAKEKAEESDRLKTAFLANMSHEIRTPMNGILGFTSLLQEPDLSGEEQHRYIDIIQQSGDRMLQTVNDIIEVSKIETGQVDVTQTLVNICDLLNYLFLFFKPETEKKGIQLFLENELSGKECNITTDKIKINSILTNLIKNAIKYSDSGSIKISCQKKSPHLLFSVEDEGIGIPVNRQKAIFERFVQADIEDSRAQEGSGLGLAITQSYAKMLGGEVWVESQEGIGSTFYATIEYIPSNCIESGLKPKESKIMSDELKKIEILVAEDDNVSFLLLQNILSKENYHLTQVTNGLEVVDMLQRTPNFHLILMDIKMPEMDGIEATKKVREFNSTIPIIAQTAYALEGDKEKALQAGCNGYISKPINKDDLLKQIRKYVDLLD